MKIIRDILLGVIFGLLLSLVLSFDLWPFEVLNISTY